MKHALLAAHFILVSSLTYPLTLNMEGICSSETLVEFTGLYTEKFTSNTAEGL
jgi:hypothetical protein